MLLAAGLLTAAHKPPPPRGELVLDAADPVITAEVAGVPLRLRVDLHYRDSIELNPDAAARLPVMWSEDEPLDVGRITLKGRIASALLRLRGHDLPVQLSEHGRPCCAGADGGIGPDLLDYATVRWVRHDAPAPGDARVLPVTADSATGLSVPSGERGVVLALALDQPDTLATAAAGAILARRWAGRWAGPPASQPLAFGIPRPLRPLAFGRPGQLGGFRFAELAVRTADFGGGEVLPADPVAADDIVVRRRLRRQTAWPAVALGADRLRRCAEIVYAAIPRTLTLRCAFDAPP